MRLLAARALADEHEQHDLTRLQALAGLIGDAMTIRQLLVTAAQAGDPDAAAELDRLIERASSSSSS
jgi:hypothetical protein